MIGLILAGGFATRLYPLTKNFPKPLLQVGQKPIIEHIIKKIERIPSIKKIIISTNAKFEYHFRDWINQFESSKEIILEIENTVEEKEKLGAIRSIGQIHKKYFDDFLIVGGDNLFEDDLKTVANNFDIKQIPIVGVFKNSGQLDISQFGTVLMDDKNIISRFKEKSNNPNSDLISTCIYVMPKSSLAKIENYLENNNPDSPGHFIKWLSENELVYGSVLKGNWWDIGTIDAYKKITGTFENYSNVIAG